MDIKRKIIKRRIIKRVIRLTSYLILLFLIISLILLNSIFFKEKIYSAHLSYVDSCIPESLTAIQNIGVSRAGQTIQTINKTTGEKETSINILVPPEFPEERLKTIKHELCHDVQLKHSRVFSCLTYLPRLSNEIECYIAEDLPNEEFEEKYQEIMEEI